MCDACPASRPPSELDGPTPRPLLNNARPQVRNGSTSRPSRPVYESKKSQKLVTNYIPSELDDGDDLDFTPNVNDNPTTRDTSHKPEKYSDRHRGHDISLMNNELQRQDRRAANHQSMPGQAVLRNNDFANRQPNQDALRVKNRTAEQHRRRQPEAKVGAYSTSSKAPTAKPLEDEPAVLRNTNLTNHQSIPGQAVLRNTDRPALRTKSRTAEQHMRRQPNPRVGTHVTSSKAPGAKTLEDGQGQKNAGSRSKPAAELVKKNIRGRPIDSATRSVSVRGWLKLPTVNGGTSFQAKRVKQRNRSDDDVNFQNLLPYMHLYTRLKKLKIVKLKRVNQTFSAVCHHQG